MSKSKLSPSLKALISASFARPNTLPATPRIRSVYERLRQEATSKDVGTSSWLALSVSSIPNTVSSVTNGGVDRRNNDDELSRVSDHFVQPRNLIVKRCLPIRADCGAYARNRPKMYWLQRRRSRQHELYNHEIILLTRDRFRELSTV